MAGCSLHISRRKPHYLFCRLKAGLGVDLVCLDWTGLVCTIIMEDDELLTISVWIAVWGA